VVSRKVQLEDATADEELEVGPKVKPEEAVFDESRKLVRRGSADATPGEAGSWPLAPPKDGWPTRVGRQSLARPEDAMTKGDRSWSKVKPNDLYPAQAGS